MHKQRALSRNSFFFIAFIFLASSCNIKTSPVELGGIDVTPPDLTDDFVIEFALRQNTTEEEERTVVIQARKFDANLNNLEALCGVDGKNCDCQLFNSATLEDFVLADKKTLNAELNTLECEIPQSVSPSSITHVRIVNETEEEKLRSGKIKILSSLTLAEVVRNTDPGAVRSIYRYSCTRFFLEGAGVSRNFTVTCIERMQLSFLLANYNFYLFSQVNEESNNFSDRAPSTYYEGDENGLTCGLRIPNYNCGLPEHAPIFGLYGLQTDLFSLGVVMYPYPDFEITNDTPLPIYGFAALPDVNLNCPPGLVKASSREALPASHVDANLPSDSSNFINETGNLNDNIFQILSEASVNFQLRKRHSTGPCSCDAQACTCPEPTSQSTIIQRVPYERRTPVFCVIPKELL